VTAFADYKILCEQTSTLSFQTPPHGAYKAFLSLSMFWCQNWHLTDRK